MKKVHKYNNVHCLHAVVSCVDSQLYFLEDYCQYDMTKERTFVVLD